MSCKTSREEIEKIISDAVARYVEEYKKSQFIVTPDFRDIHIEDMITPLEDYSIVQTLRKELGCEVHELPLRIQQRLPIYLTQELEIQIGIDHKMYWAWSAEVFSHFEHELRFHHSIAGVFFVPFHGALMSLFPPPTNRERNLLNRIISSIVDHHVQQFIMEKEFLVATASFLILESVIRELCVKLGTSEEEAESIRGLEPLVQKLLKLLKENSDHSKLREDLDDFMEIVDGIWASKVEEELQSYPELLNKFKNKKKNGLAGWRVLNYWRNKLYHGSKTWSPKVYGVLLNLICLLTWHQIPEEQYEHAFESIMKKVESNLRLMKQIGDELPLAFSFYPPRDYGFLLSTQLK